MRRSGQPSRPRARICCLLSSPKMLAIPAGNHALHRRVNVLGRRYFTGRFSGVHDWPVLGVHRGRTDPRLPIDQNPSCDDYAGSGFDRGHTVPRSDMNRSLTAMVNTFFLTNMTPQRPNVNQGTWARLEDWVRAWAKTSGWVHVISGSVFDDDDDQQPDDPADAQLSQGSSGVAVPSHYYKVIIRETTPGQVEAITLLIPNAANVPGRGAQDITKDNYLRQRIRTIAEVRRRTGLDLLPTPPFDKQTLEQAVASDLWPRN